MTIQNPDPLAGCPRLVFGSEDSTDLDTLCVVDAIPPMQEARRWCRSADENRNLIVVSDGLVRDCFKGSPDETNNALLATYALHPQQHPCPVTRPLPRVVPLKAVRAIRIVLSLLSRTPLRAPLKAALTSHDQAHRQRALAQLDFAALSISADVAKSIAFQLGQLLALIGGQELYTKSAVAAFRPALAPLLRREPSASRAPLGALRDDVLAAMVDVGSHADGDLNVFCYYSSVLQHWNRYALQARGVVIDLRSERCLVRPYDKFFRLGEVDGWRQSDFAGREPDEIVEKVDGSLVSLFRHEGRLRFASKGRFDSAQALAATRLASGYALDRLDLDRFDHVFEVICDENRFPRGFTSVRYPSEGLYLIGLRDRLTGALAPYSEVASWARLAGLRYPRLFTGTFAEALQACAEPTWQNTEGWIANFGGRRVKLKHAAYQQTSRIINGLKHGGDRLFRQYLRQGRAARASFGESLPPDFRPHLDTVLAPYAPLRDGLLAAAVAYVAEHFSGDIRAFVAHLEQAVAQPYRGLLIRMARGHAADEALHRALAWTLLKAPQRQSGSGWDLSSEEVV